MYTHIKREKQMRNGEKSDEEEWGVVGRSVVGRSVVGSVVGRRRVYRCEHAPEITCKRQPQ